ncbi:PREDICTED: protein CHROMATIN REMODELING 35-like [Camelina sativa]|uniref:Protein CHROMATIN REMODELING 35-like n=1 Tax=Camelina sativa TaxID=90675 RepID=A0ABM1RBQ6_CAMSA|nr:PREDICTED: protein CHROMATIN REMODELING 35-like [Camelina sativa]
MSNRSIIFICGKQVSNIVFKSENEMMGVLRDVARIKTRNKILLTSTLYHNNIKETRLDLEEALLSQDSDHGDKIGYLTELRMLTNKIIYNHNGEFLHEDPGLMDFTVVLKPTLKIQNEGFQNML